MQSLLQNVNFINTRIGFRVDPDEKTIWQPSEEDYAKCHIVLDERKGMEGLYVRNCSIVPKWWGDVYLRWERRYYKTRFFFKYTIPYYAGKLLEKQSYFPWL